MNKTSFIILLYFTLIAVYGLMEIVLQRYFSKNKIKKTRDKLILLMLSLFYMSIYLAPAEHVILKTSLHTGLIITGFLFLITGIILRILSLAKLGNNFSIFVEAGEENSLVTGGLYRYIRHPLYLTSLMIAVSGCIVFSCLFTWIFFVLTLIVFLRRIRKEEEFLISRFEGYGEYMKKTYKLIPYVF